MTTGTEKGSLIALAGLCIVGLIVLAILVLRVHSVDPNASATVGVITGGLIAFAKDLVQTLRSYATAAQMNRMSDQLAAAVPGNDNGVQPVTG